MSMIPTDISAARFAARGRASGLSRLPRLVGWSLAAMVAGGAWFGLIEACRAVF